MVAVTERPVRPVGITGYLDRLPEFCHKPASFILDAFAILSILTVCGATAFAGAVHTRICGHDIFLLLDSGWRVMNGQRPGLDYSPGTGTLLPLIMAAGLKLAHNSVRGVGYASAVVGAVVGLWTYAIARKRLLWTPAILASLLLTLIAVAPYPLGWLPNVLSHAMVYNRYGYALLGMVVLEAFQKHQPRSKLRSTLSGASTGILCAALLFLKASFGLVALVFAAYSVLEDFRHRSRPAGILLAFAAGILAMLAWLRFDFRAVWDSYQLLAGARSADLTQWQIRWAVAKGLPQFSWLALLVVFAGVLRSSKESSARAFSPMLTAILIFAGGALLLATNGQPAGYPLNAVLAIILANQAVAAANGQGIRAASGFLRADTVVLLVGILCVAPTFLANASGLAYAVLESRRNPPASEVARFQSADLWGLLLYDVPDTNEADYRSNGRIYVQYVNTGVDLIRRVSKPSETVFTLDMFNPFSYALLRRPAPGGMDAMGFNHQFSDRYKPTPARLYGAADIVMVPKHPSASETDANAIMRNYLAAVQSDFRLCAETDWWQLYKRPSNLEGCPAVR